MGKEQVSRLPDIDTPRVAAAVSDEAVLPRESTAQPRDLRVSLPGGVPASSHGPGGFELDRIVKGACTIGRMELQQALSEPNGSLVVLRARALASNSGFQNWAVRVVPRAPGDDPTAVRSVHVREVCPAAQVPPAFELGEDAQAGTEVERMVRRLSHELRTPLNAIVGFADLLLLKPHSCIHGEERRWVSHIAEAGRYMTALTDGLNEFAKLQSGSVQLEQSAVDVREVVVSAVNMIRPKASERDIAISTVIGEQLPRVAADKVRLEQVLLNLLSNAVKYNKPSGAIYVQVGAAVSEGVAIEVTDTGLGMAAEQLEQLFVAFNRLGRETSEVTGSGIGLCIAQRLTLCMGGVLSVRSEIGIGTTFRMVLPVSA